MIVSLFFSQTSEIYFFPFNPNSEINLSIIGPYVDYLSEQQGVKGIFGKFYWNSSCSFSYSHLDYLLFYILFHSHSWYLVCL